MSIFDEMINSLFGNTIEFPKNINQYQNYDNFKNNYDLQYEIYKRTLEKQGIFINKKTEKDDYIDVEFKLIENKQLEKL